MIGASSLNFTVHWLFFSGLVYSVILSTSEVGFISCFISYEGDCPLQIADNLLVSHWLASCLRRLLENNCFPVGRWNLLKMMLLNGMYAN